MRKAGINFFFLFVFLFSVGCSNSIEGSLTKESNRRLFANPDQNQEQLRTGTFYGCVSIPARNRIQKLLVGFEITGENCSVTVNEDNIVNVNFLGDVDVPVFSTSAGEHRTDIFIGELENNQVLIVQHHEGEVVSVTQTIYDQNDVVVYGKFGQGDYIKECMFAMTTSERLAGEKNCGK